MALSEEQERKVAEIIAAFDNGKRLSDLPVAGASNPFDLIVEVLEGGESKQARLAAMLPYLETECAYGIEFDTASSAPECTRIGNTALHKTLPVHNRMRGCLLADDGTVNAYLDPLNWTGFELDGTKGQVMVELPQYYRRFVTDGTKRRVMISEYPLPGYHLVKRKYVSAYEATVDKTDTNKPKLASVKNTTDKFCGGNGTDTTKYAGVPRTSLSLDNFRKYARNRKDNDTRWNCMTYDIQKDIYWLFVIEYATLNSQAAFNAQPKDEGYKQGGLGDGVTNVDWSKWTTLNGNYPFVPCGYTDELGNRTGEKEYTMPDGYGESGKKVSVPRYHGIENPFGHIWQWTDGVLVEAGAENDTNLHKVFVANDPAKFASTIDDGYSYVGNQARTNNFGKEHIFGEGGEIIASAVGGSNTTYLCDYNYQNIPGSGKATRGVLFGGNANYGAIAGLASACSNSAPSYTITHLGSRLCFIPE